MAKLSVYTIGVYGSSENEFFNRLTEKKIDTFVDIRQRRGVRGSEYAFANAQRLQRKLESLSIKYLHELGLAPTTAMREAQYRADDENRVTKRKREHLADEYKKRYTNEILSKFDLKNFIEELGKAGAKKIVLFCVEKSAAACHRSLVTDKIEKLFPEIKVTHL